MAFKIDNFGNISANGKTGIPSWWTYNATSTVLLDSDNLAAVLADGYFDGLGLGGISTLKVNDIIYVEAEDGNELIIVDGITPTITTAVFPVVGAGAIGTTQLADAGVTLAKLAAGVAPSHVAKFGGKVTWSGSGASLATTVTGVAATDIVVGTLQVHGTQGTTYLQLAPTTNTITATISTANTSNDLVYGYIVFRAAV